MLSKAKSLKITQRKSTGLSQLRLEGPHDGQVGGWTSCHVAAQGMYSLKLKPRGDYQAQVHSDQMVLVIVRGEARPVAWWPKMLKLELETTLGS